MNRLPALTALAGILPVLAVLLAWGINLSQGFDPCNPFLDGCTSVSRAVRSGPGLWLFKALAVPTAVCMALAWMGIGRMPDGPVGRSGRWIAALGGLSATAFLVYALFLGGDGPFYAWMRRYGVVLYFAGSGLAQLLVARGLAQSKLRLAADRVFLAVVGQTWMFGVVSAARRRLVDDPALQDRLQNALEWHFSLCLALGMVVLAWAIRSRSTMHRGSG